MRATLDFAEGVVHSQLKSRGDWLAVESSSTSMGAGTWWHAYVGVPSSRPQLLTAPPQRLPTLNLRLRKRCDIILIIWMIV